VDSALLLAMPIVFTAGAISGLAAFGFALIAVPPLLLIYDPPTVTILSILLVMVTRWVVLRDSWRDIHWRPVFLILPAALLGTVIGTAMIRELDAVYIELIASGVVLISASILLAGWRIPGVDSPAAAPVAGLISGTLATSTGMAGPPVVLLMAARGYPAQVFRGSMTVIFYATGVVSLYLLANEGLVGRPELRTSLILLPAAIAGTWVGQRSLRRVTPSQFNRIVLLLLLVTGFVGLAVGLQHLVR
jgi:uncharacterized protein